MQKWIEFAGVALYTILLGITAFSQMEPTGFRFIATPFCAVAGLVITALLAEVIFTLVGLEVGPFGGDNPGL